MIPSMPETGIRMAALTSYLKLIKKTIKKMTMACQLISMFRPMVKEAAKIIPITAGLNPMKIDVTRLDLLNFSRK